MPRKQPAILLHKKNGIKMQEIPFIQKTWSVSTVLIRACAHFQCCTWGLKIYVWWALKGTAQPMWCILNQMRPVHAWSLEIDFICNTCVSSPMAIISSGMIWTPYDWSNKFYSFNMAVVVGIVSKLGLRNEVCHRSQLI